MVRLLNGLKYEADNNEACVTGCFSGDFVIDIPQKIENNKVTKIGNYAFSKLIGDVVKFNFTTSPIKEVFLPETLRAIGNYAFYNCRDLKSIHFYNTLTDIGAGAFTGCHKVREIAVTFLEDEKSCLRELLMELPEEQTVYYRTDSGEAKLIFPEFFEEAVENTPARILETHTHGSGMMYRNCFVQRQLQFQLYDERFEWAVGRESEDTLFRLVFARLLYPYQLSEKAKKKYIEFLKEHLEACAKWTARGGCETECRFLAENCVKDKEDLDIMIREMSAKKETEILSWLMDYRHQNFETKRKIFEL